MPYTMKFWTTKVYLRSTAHSGFQWLWRFLGSEIPKQNLYLSRILHGVGRSKVYYHWLKTLKDLLTLLELFTMRITEPGCWEIWGRISKQYEVDEYQATGTTYPKYQQLQMSKWPSCSHSIFQVCFCVFFILVFLNNNKSSWPYRFIFHRNRIWFAPVFFVCLQIIPSHPIATAALLNQPAQVLSDLKTAKYHLLGLTAHATGEAVVWTDFPPKWWWKVRGIPENFRETEVGEILFHLAR